jgi:hypothetical protein
MPFARCPGKELLMSRGVLILLALALAVALWVFPLSARTTGLCHTKEGTIIAASLSDMEAAIRIANAHDAVAWQLLFDRHIIMTVPAGGPVFVDDDYRFPSGAVRIRVQGALSTAWTHFSYLDCSTPKPVTPKKGHQ